MSHTAHPSMPTVALVTLEREQVRLLQAGDIPHVRELAAAGTLLQRQGKCIRAKKPRLTAVSSAR